MLRFAVRFQQSLSMSLIRLPIWELAYIMDLEQSFRRRVRMVIVNEVSENPT
jgi:hypothetical protein